MVALGLAAVYPVLIETSGTLLVENLLLVFELAAVYCGLRIRRAGRSFRWAALAGVFTGLAALTHQNGLVLLVPLAVVAWSGVTGTLRVRAFTPAIMLLALVLTLTPWAVRNAVELHSFIPISDQAGETLFGTYNPVSAADHEVPYKWRAPYRVSTARALNAQAPQLREPAWENRLLDRALAYIGAHPFAPVAVSFHNTMELLDLEGSFAWETSTASINIPRTTAEIGVLAFWAVAVLAVLGSLTLHAQRAPRWLWLVPILFFVSTVWVRAEAPRFRLAIDPFVVMLAACALVSWVPRLRALGAVDGRGPNHTRPQRPTSGFENRELQVDRSLGDRLRPSACGFRPVKGSSAPRRRCLWPSKQSRRRRDSCRGAADNARRRGDSPVAAMAAVPASLADGRSAQDQPASGAVAHASGCSRCCRPGRSARLKWIGVRRRSLFARERQPSVRGACTNRANVRCRVGRVGRARSRPP